MFDVNKCREWVVDRSQNMGPNYRNILDCLGQDMQVLYLGRAPRTKETLPDFLKWRRVTRPPLVFRGLTGSQRTPGFWGVTITMSVCFHLSGNRTFRPTL